MSADDARNYLQLVIEEYKTLRDESKQASINMFAAMQWGSAILGLLFSAGFSQWNRQHAVVLIVFLIVIPTVSAMAVFLWLGEAMRFKRAGDFICLIERKALFIEGASPPSGKTTWPPIQRALEVALSLPQSGLNLAEPLAWERWLRDTRERGGTAGHLDRVYRIRLALFPVLGVISILAGLYYIGIHPRLIPAAPPMMSGLRDAAVDAAGATQVKSAILIILSCVWFVLLMGFAYLQATVLKVKQRTLGSLAGPGDGTESDVRE